MGSSVIDNFWVIVCSVLVFFMQPGFMCLESGLTRAKNSINVAIKNLADFVFSVLCFWFVGFGLMFGVSHAGLLGGSGFIVDFGNDFHLSTFFIFQTMFCGTATTIFSGAVAERMKFSSYIIVSILISLLIYPLFGHWAWNGLDSGTLTGWLGASGFVDFAGSTVVHSVGGWIALATLIVLGPRKGRFLKDGRAVEINGSNLPLAVLGTLLLWIAWIGFNGGSTLVMDWRVPGIIVNTILAGAAGAAFCLVAGYVFTQIPKVSYLINGSLGGLVAITACCHCVTTTYSILIGGVAGLLCILVEDLLLRIKIDDAIGAVPVHLGCGIWGTIAVALFGNLEIIDSGLTRYGQLLVQLEGIVAAFVVAFLIPLFIIRKIDKKMPLRVSEESEEVGLNISEHGAKTETADFFRVMQLQEETGDLSLRVPVDPFTDTGVIAGKYNKLMTALQNARASTEAIVSVAKDAIITFGSDDLNVISMNPSGCAMFGCDSRRPLSTLVGNLKDILTDCPEKLLSGSRMELEGKTLRGRKFPIDAVVTKAMVGDDYFYVGTFRDITITQKRDAELARQKAYFQQLFDGSPEAVISTDMDGNITRANKGFETIFGFHASEVTSLKSVNVIVPGDMMVEMATIRQTVLSGKIVNRETHRKHKNGKRIPVSMLGFPILIDGGVEGIFYVYQNISKRKELEDQLYRKAFYDSLTGVANRILFMERVGQAVARQERKSHTNFAIFMIDLDRFKWVNDTMGHLAGDLLLEQVAQRFLCCVRSVDTVARLGGDEFAILLEDIDDTREIIEIAKRIKDNAETVFKIYDKDVFISASIGIVTNSSDYTKSQDILRDADIAMYRAKATGKSRYKVFSRKLYDITLNAIELENDLKKAVAEKQLKLYYQPIINADNGTVKGFEALLRWFHPVKGMISPVDFIPLAEETGLIISIGKWVIEEACRQLKSWHGEVDSACDLTMSVNISPRQFMHNDLEQTIRCAIHATDLPPQCLVAELTESAVMEKPESVIGQLNRLKKTGIRIAIDDFGTGYSSLSCLRRFPLDYLKIDKSFVDEVNADHENMEIARAIITLAHNLNLEVVAEGIENVEQLETLKGLKCNYIQGFYYSKPVEASIAGRLIEYGNLISKTAG